MIGAILPPFVRSFDMTGSFDMNGSFAGADLWPEERAVVADATERRRAEFAGGRFCARQALRELGRPPVAITRGERGAPRWPDGVVGSITHTRGYCGAAVAESARAAAIGIDAEPDEPAPPRVLAGIGLPAELAAVAELAAAHPGVHWDRLLFSAKESIYKAWFPLTGQWLGFHDAHVTVDPLGVFTAQVGAQSLRGRWLTTAGLIITALVIA